jgi:AmmeMemoRadiSam system protein A
MPDPAHPFITLAAEAIAAYLSEHRVIDPPSALFRQVPDAELPAGVFVCLKRQGQLRGCLGTTEPAHGTRAAEIVANAIGAATRDTRFPSVNRLEIADLSICVDILGPFEPVNDLSQLDPKRYGVLLKTGFHQTVLLPDIEGVESSEEQLVVVRKKAGIGPNHHADLFRFEVQRYRS